jgi:hypothetical protein
MEFYDKERLKRHDRKAHLGTKKSRKKKEEIALVPKL